MKKTNGERLIESLKSIVDDQDVTDRTKEVASYLLEDAEIFLDEKKFCGNRLTSLLYICQIIFSNNSGLLVEMNMRVLHANLVPILIEEDDEKETKH